MTTQLEQDVELAEKSGFAKVDEDGGEMYVGFDYDIHALCNAVREQAVPQWISVEDRLPNTLTHCLVFCGGTIQWAFCNSNKQFVGYDKFINGVTHWMPLPDAPREDE